MYCWIYRRWKFIRIYPIPFRKLENEFKYQKYQWVEMDIKRNLSDFRPENYYLNDIDTINMLDKISPNNNWKERKDIIFRNKNHLYKDLKYLIECSRKKGNECVSLAIFKPSKIIDLVVKEEKEKNWDNKKIDAIYSQYDLFNDNYFKLVKKLPYRFSYIFQDINGIESKLFIEDWEIGALFWNCLKNNNEKYACDLVKN